MRKITMFITCSALLFMSYCGDSGATSTGGSSCLDPHAHEFYNEVLALTASGTEQEVKDSIPYYNAFKGVTGTYTPAQVLAFINYVAPDETTAVNFYNTWNSVVAGKTTTEITTDINFYNTWNTIVAGKTTAQVTTALNHVCPDNTTQVNFYNTWNTVVAGYTTTQVTDALNYVPPTPLTVVSSTFTMEKGIVAGSGGGNSIRLIGISGITDINIKIYAMTDASFKTITPSGEYFIYSLTGLNNQPVMVSGTFRMGDIVYRVDAVLI